MPIEKTGNMKAEQRLQIREGMSIEDVKKYGSKGQQLAASLFAMRGHDEIYDEKEAKEFNNFNFSVKDNVFTMYDRERKQITEIKYDNIEDLHELLNNKKGSNWEMRRLELLKKGKTLKFTNRTDGGKITLDLSKDSITVDGVKGEKIITGGYEKITVKNSDLEKIDSSARKVIIQNTKDKGVIWDSPTRVNTDKKAAVDVDNKSYVTRRRTLE